MLPSRSFARPLPTSRQLSFALIVLSIALAAGLAALMLARPQMPLVTTTGTALIGGPFTLTDQDGRRVSDQDFRGKYLLVFFGYTYCPDVCPSTLQVMSAALDRLGPQAGQVTPVFITLDPERDTPPVLKSYVANFHPSLIGLTGRPQNIAQAARAYRVYYDKAKGQETKPDYLLDHSTFVYLMGPDGAYVKHFDYGIDADSLAAGIAEALGH